MNNIKTVIEQHAAAINHTVDTIAAGSSVSIGVYVLGKVANIFDQLINPILAGVSLILTIIWGIYRLRKK